MMFTAAARDESLQQSLHTSECEEESNKASRQRGALLTREMHSKLANSWARVNEVFRSWDSVGDGMVSHQEFMRGFAVVGNQTTYCICMRIWMCLCMCTRARAVHPVRHPAYELYTGRAGGDCIVPAARQGYVHGVYMACTGRLRTVSRRRDDALWSHGQGWRSSRLCSTRRADAGRSAVSGQWSVVGGQCSAAVSGQ